MYPLAKGEVIRLHRERPEFAVVEFVLRIDISGHVVCRSRDFHTDPLWVPQSVTKGR